MEDRPFDPNDEKSPKPEDTSESRRPGESLFQYFLRKRESSQEAELDDDSEESETTPSKKRWRLFKGFFKNIVSEPSEPNKGESGKEEPTPLSWQSIESTEYTPADIVPDTEVRANDLDTASESVPLQVLDTEGTTPQEQFEPEQATLAPEEAQPDIRTIETADEPFNVPERQIRDTEIPNSESVTTPNSEPVVEKETVIERGVGSALPVLLVGAEYFARKRADRKLDRKFEDRTNSLEKDITRDQLAQKQLETLVKQNREQLEKLKQERGVESLPAERLQPNLVETTPETRPKMTAIERPVVARSEKPESIRRETVTEQRRPVLDGEPVSPELRAKSERMIERSHEVKDEPAAGPSAASVGAIMAAQTAQRQGAVQSTPIQGPQDTSGLAVISEEDTTDIYKRAMKAGFWSAVVIIIFGIIAYLVIK